MGTDDDPRSGEVVVLGAGVAGLAVASVLGERATVLEQESRPGGLTRTERYGDYWFDRVLHILHFDDACTERRVRALPGLYLAPCPPEAWVECSGGVTRYPLQLNLGGLDPQTAIRCLCGLAEVNLVPAARPPGDYQAWLLQSLGRGLCDTFFLPYNRKQWKRPLHTLAPAGFQWNISRPALNEALRGALIPGHLCKAYNARAYYPRPPADAPMRGMELLSRALAKRTHDLRLNHRVLAVDLDRHRVAFGAAGQVSWLGYQTLCATIALPRLMGLCQPVPEQLSAACRRLSWNRVLNAAFRIKGPRPGGRGLWRYYSDEDLCFTRLIYTHEFDPLCAPDDGWGLMVEMTEPCEWPVRPEAETLARARRDAQRIGVLPEDHAIVGEHLMVADPAYVAFGLSDQATIDACRSYLLEHDVHLLGRYGRWEYSSMAQVIGDGYAWAFDEAGARSELAVGPCTAGGR